MRLISSKKITEQQEDVLSISENVLRKIYVIECKTQIGVAFVKAYKNVSQDLSK